MGNKKTLRPRVTPEEWEIIKKFRKDHSALKEECEVIGIPLDQVTNYWYKNESFSINVRPKALEETDFRQQLLDEVKKHKYKFPKHIKPKGSHLLVVDPADVHIGKLASAFETGEEYNSNIAVNRVKEGVNGIIDKSKGFDIERVLYISGNDRNHIDTPKRTTTSGTPQDTDGMWYENFTRAFKLEVDVIHRLLDVAPVHYVYNPSNHDYMTGFMLAQAIEARFHGCINITFDVSMRHRKYYAYGTNLIGSTHGDGAKHSDLPLLMANESKDWGNCKHKYIYTHHLHHKTSKDYIGVTVETLRSPSASDSWHHRQGYQHAPKAIEGFVHHIEHGQVARITHLF